MSRLLIAALVLLAVGACPGAAAAQVTELGAVELTVGPVGSAGLFGSGAVVGNFPGELFADGQARAVASILEDDAGTWTLLYSGGAADGWHSAAVLDAIVVAAEYADGVDSRVFVAGGFVADVQGRALELAPPLPSGREWDTRAGERLTLGFARRVLPAAPDVPAPLAPPVAEPDSIVDFVSRTTPGGPGVVQVLVTLLVFTGYIFTAPATPWGLLLGAVVLVTTPWVPVLFGVGSTIAASIIALNIVLGALCWKTWAARTEA